MTLKKRAAAIATLEVRHKRALNELHPELRRKVEMVLYQTGQRFRIWDGYRNEADQEDAYDKGASDSHFGQSPHNFKPSYAADLVLNPAKVTLRPHAKDAEMPDLWDDESEGAIEAWQSLERACQNEGLERVAITDRRTGKKKRDLPHVQLKGWRSLLPQ